MTSDETRVPRAVAPYVEADDPPGLAWLVMRGDDVAAGAVGTHAPGGDGGAIEREAIFRISSVTKPVCGVVALMLLDDGVLGLDDPIQRWLPELADRRVLAVPNGPLDETVPAQRPITVRDVLTFRLGTGMDFGGPFPGVVLEAMAAAGLNVGPPAPSVNPGPDEWLRRFAGLPLMAQPGERWLYHTSAEVLGVLLARASGQSLPELLAERLLEPLGMTSTGFHVPADRLDRFGPQWVSDPETGEPALYDDAAGQWSRPPAFAGAGDGLVSTVDDLSALADLLRRGGVTADGRRLVRAESLAAMRTDVVGGVADAGGRIGWGYAVGVQLEDEPSGRPAGSYGWDGGMGSTWWISPDGIVGVMLTNRAWSVAGPSPVFDAFWGAISGG